jgi:signal transduction histidine kinase
MKDQENKNMMLSCFDTLEEEKRSLAHELHTEIGHDLSAIKKSAQQIARQDSNPDSYHIAKNIIDLTEHMSNLLHSALQRLHPAIFDTLNIMDALTDLTQFNYKHCALECGIHTEGNIEGLSFPLKITVYRMVQEALSNAARHGEASRANIQISRDANGLNMAIENNGKSLDETYLQHLGIGILSMRERIHAFGGEFSIHNMPSGGVIVHATLPLETIH